MEEFNDIAWRDGRFASLPFPFPITIFSYSMYSGSMYCRVCSKNIKVIVIGRRGWKGKGRKVEVAETKALYHSAGRNRPRKEKRLGKKGRSSEHAIFHLVTRPIHFTGYSWTFLSDVNQWWKKGQSFNADFKEE